MKIYAALGQLDLYLELLKDSKGVLLLPRSVKKELPEIFTVVQRVCEKKQFAFILVNKDLSFEIIVNSFLVKLFKLKGEYSND